MMLLNLHVTNEKETTFISIDIPAAHLPLQMMAAELGEDIAAIPTASVSDQAVFDYWIKKWLAE